jgi:hypothetical protein
MKRLLVGLFGVVAVGQTPPKYCDAELIRQVQLTNSKDADRYLDRGGRCEGLYSEQVSLTGNLVVESLTAGSVTPSAWSGRPLTVQCRYKEPADVHIQAFLLLPRPFYRLDALQRGSVISWNWDTEVVSRYAKPVNVGLVAWTSALVDGQTQRVYLPVTGPAGGPRDPVKLVVVTPVEVSEAYVSVASTVPGEKPLRQKEPVGKGSYLKNQKIEIDIPPLPHEGLYRVEVTGKGGIVSTPEFLIYSGGK